MSDTAARLEAIADPGKFELLVTNVLRTVNQSYTALIHTGINTVGNPLSGKASIAASRRKPIHLFCCAAASGLAGGRARLTHWSD